MDPIQTFGLTVAVTELLKNLLGWSGSQAQALGVAVGLVFGTLEKITDALPSDYRGWIQAVLYGLTVGVTAVGLYHVADKFVTKTGNSVVVEKAELVVGTTDGEE